MTASMDDTTRDENDIRKLVALYAQRADDYAIDAWAGLFIEDGALHMGSKTVQGQPGLREWLAQVQASVGRTRHMMVNAVISVETADTATGSVDMLMLTRVDDTWVNRGAPRYRDRYVRTPAGWRFAERTIETR